MAPTARHNHCDECGAPSRANWISMIFSKSAGGTAPLTPGDLIVFTTYLRTGFKPIRQLAKYLGQIARALASGDRILSLLTTPLEIKDEADAVVAPPLKGHIIFENVSFEYEPQRVALRNVSFEVKPGQKAVLAGPSGSGKSTIASLLLRLHDPCEGRILIDGKDIRSYTLESLRSQISIVMQDSPLFDSMKAPAPCDRVDLVALTTKARKKGAELCGL